MTRLILIAALLLVPASAAASGSYSLKVSTSYYDLNIRQTFRKIMVPGKSGGYNSGVQEKFLKFAGALVPELSKVLAGSAKKRIKALGRSGLDLPTVHCPRRRSCPLDKVNWPALVPLKPVQQKGNDRTEYIVHVPFNRKPSSSQLAWLQSRLQEVVDQYGNNFKSAPLAVIELPAPAETGRSFTVVTRPKIAITTSSARWFQREVLRLSKIAKKAVQNAIKTARGVTLAKYTPKLRLYVTTKTLPALITAWAGNDRVQIQVTVAVKNWSDEAAKHTFLNGISATLQSKLTILARP
jgi:hypothetical protein